MGSFLGVDVIDKYEKDNTSAYDQKKKKQTNDRNINWLKCKVKHAKLVQILLENKER